MSKVIKYKIYYIISNRLILLFVMLLLLLTNFHAIFSSGILLSGGSSFNGNLKYELILNNYLLVSSLYSLFFSIYLGSNIIGPDIQTGNMQVILTSYPIKWKYYLGSFLAALFLLVTIHILIVFNIFIIFVVFDIPFLTLEVLNCFLGNLLNASVVLSATGIASIYMERHLSTIVGLFIYAFYSVYTYNVVPFVNTYFIFDVTKYRNLLCNLAPITNILPVSYTDPQIIEIYSIQPIISNVYCYQFIYCLFAILLGAFCFQRKEL